MTFQETVKEALTFFEICDERVSLRDDRPEWLYETVKAAHGGELPNDWRYQAVMEALSAMEENAEDFELNDEGDEIDSQAVEEVADGIRSIYTADVLQWYADCISRTAYTEDAHDLLGASQSTYPIEYLCEGMRIAAEEVVQTVVEHIVEHVMEAE